MTEYWDVKEPRLIVSVTGGAKNFKVDAKIIQHFRDAILKVSICNILSVSTYVRQFILPSVCPSFCRSVQQAEHTSTHPPTHVCSTIILLLGFKACCTQI